MQDCKVPESAESLTSLYSLGHSIECICWTAHCYHPHAALGCTAHCWWYALLRHSLMPAKEWVDPARAGTSSSTDCWRCLYEFQYQRCQSQVTGKASFETVTTAMWKALDLAPKLSSTLASSQIQPYDSTLLLRGTFSHLGLCSSLWRSAESLYRCVTGSIQLQQHSNKWYSCCSHLCGQGKCWMMPTRLCASINASAHALHALCSSCCSRGALGGHPHCTTQCQCCASDADSTR